MHAKTFLATFYFIRQENNTYDLLNVIKTFFCCKIKLLFSENSH